jgi:hypothetical protein
LRGAADCLIACQNQRYARFNGSGNPGLFLPGAMFKPESLPCYTAWGLANRLDGNHLTGQYTLVLH